MLFVPTPETTLAQYLLHCIEQRLPPGTDVIKAIAGALGLGYHAVYRRLSGKAEFKATEVVLLSRHFGISLDGYIRPGTFAFQVSAINQPIQASNDFLTRLHGLLHQAVQIPNVTLQYATTEVPVFHYLQYPVLMAFKLHMWSCTTWRLTSYKNHPFQLHTIGQDTGFATHCRQIFALYNKLPSEECWPQSILDNTLSQIKALHEQGGFAEDGGPQQLFEMLHQMIDYQEDTAAVGIKSTDGSFALYHNEMMHTSNVFLLQSPSQRQVYFTFDNPNFIMTDHPDFCQHTSQWFDLLRANSLCISVENSRLRRPYFDQLRKRLENAQRMLHV